MAPTQMKLYICKDCELLLMRPDMKFELFESSELKPNGWYDRSGNGEEELAYYICPSCGNNSDDDGETEHKLDSILLPISAAASLIKLWYKRRDAEKKKMLQEADNHADNYCYGIPLDDPEIPEVVLEHLL